MGDLSKIEKKWKLEFLTLFIGGALLQTVFVFPTFAAVSLDEIFLAAVKRSETLTDQDQRILQTQEHASQTKGSLLPQISANGFYFIQDSPKDPLLQEIFPATQPTLKLSVTQPIFRGLREFSTLRQLKHLSESQQKRKDQLLIILYDSVTLNFFEILSYQQDVKNLNTDISLHEDRISELKNRAQSGQSSEHEPLAAAAAKATAKAQLKQVEAQLRKAQEVFTFLTDLPQTTPIQYDLPTSHPKESLESLLKAVERRPDILAAQSEVEALNAKVATAKGEHLPTIDIQGNYYLVRPPGFFNDIRWDVQANISLPLFSGGVIHSKVKEAASQKIQAELTATRTKRQAEQEVRSLYQSYESNLEQIESLTQAMQLSEQNYRVLRKDYTRGLTRNLEVLQALTQFQENKRTLDRTRWNAQSDWVRLQILSTLQPPPVVRN